MKPGCVSRFWRRVSGRAINFLRRFSIYRRLLFSFLAIIIVTNSLVGLFSFYISAREVDQNISGSTRQVLNGLISSINVRLAHYEELSNQIGSSDQVRGLLKKCRDIRGSGHMNAAAEQKYNLYKGQLENILYQAAQSYDISNLEILSDSDEFTQADYSGNPRGASLENPDQYRKTDEFLRAVDANGSLIWYDTSKDVGVFRYEKSKTIHISGYLTLTKSIPDFGPQPSSGVIIVNVPLSIFERMTNLQNMYDQNEVVFLAGRKGTATILNSTYLIHRMPDAEQVGRLVAAKNAMMTEKISASSVMFVCASLSKVDMSVVYMVGKNEIYKSIFLIRNIVIAVTIACILCSLLMSYFVTSSIFVPLKKLERTMKRVGENGLQAEYQDDRQDEIGFLGSQFNRMLARIRELLDTLVEEERIRKNEQIKRKDAELDALQMQIDPHFMYNTLDLIRWNAMFEENGEGKVSKMLAAFSNFLRFNTVHTNKLVEVDEEIRHVQAYAAVLEFKSEFNVEVKINIGDESILACKIPKLTFQPIVENAVKHGVGTRGEKILISISAYRAGGDLCISIRDNGSGIPEEQREFLNDRLRRNDTSGKSIGLKNVNERIKLHFGDKYGLEIESEEGSYTSVIIRIPAAGEP